MAIYAYIFLLNVNSIVTVLLFPLFVCALDDFSAATRLAWKHYPIKRLLSRCFSYCFQIPKVARVVAMLDVLKTSFS